MEIIEVPNPLPAPIPGGGPRSGYQWQFNHRYYYMRDPKLRPLAFGLAASPWEKQDALTSDEQVALANELYDQTTPGKADFGPAHVDFDQQIDFWRWDPYGTMFERSQIYGYQRVPIGTGNTTQPPNVVNPADLQGPPVPGKYLLVTCDINQL